MFARILLTCNLFHTDVIRFVSSFKSGMVFVNKARAYSLASSGG